ncbi:hypothetical protein SEA_ROBINROSE_110 [Microbacterium phage RobinRose]|nr:hypothetical protein SEA_ROBINROSE_110 [Microbacterium phage RobinRose]
MSEHTGTHNPTDPATVGRNGAGQMNTQADTIHATAEQISAVSKAHGDSDAMLAARIKAVRIAAKSGVKMSTLADDLKLAATEDATVNAVSSTILGFALAASDVVDLAGVGITGLSSSDLATLYRGAKRVKNKAFRAGIKAALSSLTDEADAQTRFTVAVEAARVAASTKLAAPAAREPRPNVATVDTADDATESQPVGSVVTVIDDGAAVLAALHAATRWVQNGGEWSADLASAVAQLSDATSAARKRTRQLAAV